jgi:hypothetical protein
MVNAALNVLIAGSLAFDDGCEQSPFQRSCRISGEGRTACRYPSLRQGRAPARNMRKDATEDGYVRNLHRFTHSMYHFEEHGG